MDDTEPRRTTVGAAVRWLCERSKSPRGGLEFGSHMSPEVGPSLLVLDTRVVESKYVERTLYCQIALVKWKLNGEVYIWTYEQIARRIPCSESLKSISGTNLPGLV